MNLRFFPDALFTLIYPQACDICKESVERKADGYACEACWSKTRIFSDDLPHCEKCGKYRNETSAKNTSFCRDCDDHYYNLARSTGAYEFALTASILRLKKTPHIPKRLRNLFVSAFLESSISNPTRIIPVPLSQERLYERGFNQAELLAKLLSKKTGIPLDQDSLLRKHHSKIHRAGMDKRGRQLSVEKSFATAEDANLQGEIALLVDDVFASGATVSSCAKVLKKAGASDVFVFTAARSI